MRPMLGELELPQVQVIDTSEKRAWVEHQPPGMEGSWFQNMGRNPTDFLLHGIATGTDAFAFVEKLDRLFRAGEPVEYVADIATATQIDQVVIDSLAIRELAGKPEHYEYALSLREFHALPAPDTEPPPEPEVPDLPVEPIIKTEGALEVEVTMTGQPDFDYSRVLVTAEGIRADGTPFSQLLTERVENRWFARDLPAGDYTVTAIVMEPEGEV